MRTRTDEQVRRWLKDHPEESLKILRDIENSYSGRNRQSDMHSEDNESRTTYLFENLLPLQGSDIEQKLNSFCGNVIKCLNIIKCAIFILNPVQDQLDIKGQTNWGKYIPVKIGHGIVGQSASLNKVIYIENPSQGNLFNLMVR
jgi:hypothetical protein